MEEYKPVILMVEDNRDVLFLNSRQLRHCGYEVVCTETIAQAERALKRFQPDVAVLDILLPDGNGLEWLPHFKALTDTPVLFLSSLNKHEDVLRGIQAGGDDYMKKPYRLDELIARVDALWRRERRSREKAERLVESMVLERGPLKLNLLSGIATLGGTDMLLTGREFALLLTLVRREGRFLDADALYRAAWGAAAVGDGSAVKIAVSRLRKKLEGSSFCIVAQRGSGYRFGSQV